MKTGLPQYSRTNSGQFLWDGNEPECFRAKTHHREFLSRRAFVAGAIEKSQGPTVMTDVPSLSTGGLKDTIISAVMWNVPALLGAW
jgi:hypothetical protein